MKKLAGKVALVTSATRGIGLESAVKLAQNGAIGYMEVAGGYRLGTPQYGDIMKVQK